MFVFFSFSSLSVRASQEQRIALQSALDKGQVGSALFLAPCHLDRRLDEQATDALIKLCDDARSALTKACEPIKKKPKNK